MTDLATFQNAIAHWGTCTILKPLPGGYRNVAYLIECQDELLVAKSTRRSQAALAWLAAVHEAAEQAGLLVPRLLPCKDGRLVVSGITVEKFLNGATPTENQLEGLLPSIKKFHALTQHIPQRPGFASSNKLLHTAQGGDIDLQQMPRPLVAWCRHHWQKWTNAPQSVIHGDLGINNILVIESGQFGLVDWDEARVDGSQFDTLVLQKALGQTLSDAEENLLASWEIAVCWLVEPDHARRLAQAFGHQRVSHA